MLVGFGGKGIDGGVVRSDASLGAPAPARLVGLVGRSRRTHTLALPPTHALQQPDACGAHVASDDGVTLTFETIDLKRRQQTLRDNPNKKH